MKLYSFTNFTTPGRRYDGAPRAVPPFKTGGYISASSTRYQLLDVINKFQWTSTPSTGRQEVPSIYLKEKRLKTNALIAQAIYYGLSLGRTGQSLVTFIEGLPDGIRQAVQFIIGGYVGGAAGQILKQIGNLIPSQNVQNAAAKIADYLPGVGAILGATEQINFPEVGLNLLQYFQDFASKPEFNLSIDSLGSDYLKPYEGLYITEDTQFVYNLPYFNNLQNSIGNAFNDSDDAFVGSGVDNILGTATLMEGMRTIANAAAVITELRAPGIYIERPKFYKFSNEGEAIEFSFPLINTGWSNFNDVMQNWQLLFLLTYQNRPNRRTRELIDPSVIYEITIPGVRYFPFAYIEKMVVEFKGARRRMNMEVPYGNGTTTINTIIPDAYLVKVTLRTLVNETQNFLYSMISDKQNIITVSDSRSPGELFLTEVYNQRQVDGVGTQNRTLPTNNNVPSQTSSTNTGASNRVPTTTPARPLP